MSDTDAGPLPSSRWWPPRRSATNRDLAGVIGGLGDLVDLDPAWLRLATVGVTGFLTFEVGGGAQLLVVVPYALAWAALPTADARSPLAQLPRRAAFQELGLIAALVAISTLLAVQPGLGLVAALGAAGALLLRDRPATDTDEAGSPSAGDGPAEPAAGIVPTGPTPVDRAPGDGPAGWAWPRRARPVARRHRARRPRRQPALWPLAAALLAVVGVVAATGLVAGWAVDVRLVVNILLAVVGAVMVVSAWRGRAGVLLVTVPLLLPVWFATSAADIGGHDGVGRLQARPMTTGRDEALSYELGYGLLDVDLTALELASGSTTRVEVAVTVGRAEVTVPAAARVEVVGEVGLGVVDVPRDRWGGASRLAAHARLDLARPPLVVSCDPTQVGVSDLRQLAIDAGIPLTEPTSPDRADADLLDAIEAAGFDRPTVVGQESWYDGTAEHTTDVVSAPVSRDRWALCRPEPPDPDPAVVVIDATVGLGTLEVHRV